MKLNRMKALRVVRKGSWKKQEVGKSEFGKFLFKLERAQRSLKEPSKVGKLLLKLECLNELVTKVGKGDTDVDDIVIVGDLKLVTIL